MGRLPATTAISIALHTGALALVAVRATACDHEPPAAAPPPAPIAIAEPVEVTLWAPDATPAPSEPRAAPPARSRLRAGAVPARRATTAPATAAPLAAPPAAAPPVPRGTLAMRTGADLTLHDEIGPPREHAPAAPAPEVTGVAPAPTEPVAPLSAPAAPDSGALDPNETHEAFSLDVAPDGTVHIRDGGNVRLGAGRTPPAPPPAVPENPTREDAPRPIEKPVGKIGATVARFDVTDWLMRRHGLDPYASAKLHQLDATRDRRAEMGSRHATKELARAGELVQRQLETLWATVPDAATRKATVFELWDECSESGSEEIVASTAHVRARIAAFVRAHLPPGQPDAFTAAELAALNAKRQSAAVFAPYE